MNSCKPCSLEDFKAWDGYIERLCLLKPKDRTEQLMFNTWERKQPQCKSRENYVCDLNSAELKRWLGGRGTYCSAEGQGPVPSTYDGSHPPATPTPGELHTHLCSHT